jgi:type IV secretion system protein VirB3
MSANEPPAGFEVPLHRSLVEPILLGGVPRTTSIIIGTVSAALGLGLQQWMAGLFLWVVGHTLCVVCARHDPDFADVLIRHLRQKGYWSC